jgi:hypothetical protein
MDEHNSRRSLIATPRLLAPCAQVRFVKHVFPGETLRTEMWLQGGHRVVFRTLVVERGEVAIANAAVVLHPGKVQLPARL